jgi:hypothetical protein
MNQAPVIGLLVALALTAGCQRQSDANLRSELEALRTEQAQKLGELSRDRDQIREQLATTDSELFALQRKVNSRDKAFFLPDDLSTKTISSNLGSFAVRVSDVRPYANGSRAKVEFGNLYLSNISRVSFTLEWGKRGPDGNMDTATTRDQKIDIAPELRAGSWTKADVVLDGITPAELGWVEVRDLWMGAIALN